MKKRSDGLLQKAVTVTLPNGGKKRKSFYGHSQAEINKKILAYQGEVEKGRIFSDVADEWQEIHDKTVRYNTAECYRAPLKDLKSEWDKQYINDITPQDCQRYINNYAAEGRELQPRSRQTVNLRLMVMNMVFEHAVNSGDIANSPARYVELPKGLAKKKRSAPTDEQITDIKKGAEGFRLYPLFLLYTGMRKTEALALTWEDINWKSKVIHVNKIVEYHGNKPVLRPCTKSDAGMRDVPLLDALSKVLKPMKGEGYIFPGKGGLMTRGEFDERWRKLNLGITAHQLRHAYATQMYEAGIDAEVAQVLLGVSSVKVVRDIYTHIKDDKVKSAVKALNKSFK
ncbi:MAG: tyrosine-type recombinase/integrase [Oscillospiraceae bacterium]|nr:tyrosine-type recombinase/integrase [Oscillospiraceae bacterium]